MRIEKVKKKLYQSFYFQCGLILLISFFSVLASCANHEISGDSEPTGFPPAPSVQYRIGKPENIILTWKDNPSTSQAVTWRTDSSVPKAFAEFAKAEPSPGFTKYVERYRAETIELYSEDGMKYYHSVNFKRLRPKTLYAYRVGSEKSWSEWFHFRTSSAKEEPFAFIYLGDAQNKIFSLWSRTIRAAYSYAPNARFIIHTGDLVDKAVSKKNWDEWFQAGGFIFSMISNVPIAGNHEYENAKQDDHMVTPYWRPQFTLPENGIKGLEETVYYIDYQGVRLIALNSNERLAEQALWLEQVLANNPNTWTVVSFHHPIFSAAKKRDNIELRYFWKPIFDKYKVDLVLQGHDHNYARGVVSGDGAWPDNQNHETVYVISVSGPKMYGQDPNNWIERSAVGVQLFQIVSISKENLHFKSLSVTGELIDSFKIIKKKGKPKVFIEDSDP